MHIEIKNAEITNTIFLKWEYDQTDMDRKTNIKAKADSPIHEDLREAFEKLIPHFVLLTEMKKKPQMAKIIDLKQLDEDLLSKFKVRAFTLEEKNGETSVKISGYKILTSGKAISFETPNTKRGNQEEGYEFFDELMICIEDLKDEILEYMEGKESERAQVAMEFGDEAEDFEPETDLKADAKTEAA
jgi:hypothetical protein